MTAAVHVQTSAHRAFSVTVRTPDQHLSFSAIGKTSSAVHASALDLFDGLCSVVVIPTREKIHGN